MLGQGVFGAGIALGPNDETRIRAFRIGEGAFVNRIVLDCIQWPDDQKNPLHALWTALRFKGEGEPLFAGSVIEGWQAPGTVTLLEELPQPPSARAVRRTGFRAVVMDGAGNVVFELGGTGSTTTNNLLAQVWTSFQRAPQNQMAPLRTIMGTIGYEIPTGLVDMQENERSIAQVMFAGTAPADPAFRVFVLHMFEGRNESSPTLEAANAIS
jgi:hypothetical protein